MSVYCYDTEFLEDGRTIDLISIGIVCEDGREYYAINADADWDRIRENDWLMENVVVHLPTHSTGQVKKRTGFGERGRKTPPSPTDEHNALADARWGMDLLKAMNTEGASQ